MSIKSVINDTASSESFINAQKPLPPTISSYSVGGLDDTALDPAGGQTVQINGTGFLPGATITFDGNAVAVVTYSSANRLTFTSPAKSAGTYTIYVVNPDGGTAIYIPGIIYSVLPTWTTSAGTLGSYYETTSISNTVVASGDAPITYSLYSGSLPTGSTLYANGVITGTAPVDSSSTTYSFTIEAIDAQLQGSTRSFSLTINTDVVTWVTPAANTTYTYPIDSAIANVTLSATDAAGYAVTYSANALPTGLSLTGANISGTPTVIADSSTLLTATAATTNRTATRTINWSITVANDPYFEYNTLLIPGASTTFVDDASTNNFAVTIAGDTKPNNNNPYTPGYYSNYFDGTGDYLTVATNSAFNFGTGDFTIEAWVNPASLATFFISSSTGSGGFFFGYNDYTGGYGWGRTAVAWDYQPVTTASINAWQHVAVSRSGTSMRLFVNGIQQGTTQTNSTSYDLSITGTTIGSQGATYYLTGYLSNVRIVKGTAVYTSNFTPSTTPLTAISGTSLLTCQSNRFIDNSTNNFTLTVNGNTTINSFDPFVPNSSYSSYGSGYFDGDGDYLTTPASTNLVLPNNQNWTVEAWVYLVGYNTAANQILFLGNGSGGWTTTFNCDFGVNSSTGYTYLEYANGGVNGTAISGSTVVPLNRWTHLAWVFNGTAKTVTSYVNGIVDINAGSMSTYSPPAATVYATIGRTDPVVSTPTLYFWGYMNDLRVVKGTAVYTSAFTPPSAPLTAVANTSLLTLQNNQSVNNSTFLDNSTNNFFVTRNGNTTQGTFSPYGGNWSNYFDGSGDYLTVAFNSAFNMGSGDFTIEFWVNTTSTSAYTCALRLGDAWTTGSWALYLNDNSGNGYPSWWSFTLNQTLSSSGALVNNGAWHHIALVRNGTTMTMYIDGTSRGTLAVSTNSVGNASTNLWIARDSNNVRELAGYLSNIRIVKGTALYTASFTPSTTPLTTTSQGATSSQVSLLTCADNRLVDDSINNFTIAKAGDVSVQRFSPFNPSSVTPTSYSGYFDGSGDYLQVANDATNQMGSGDWTAEAWIYITSYSSINPVIAKGGSSTDWFLATNNSNGRLYFGVGANDYFALSGPVVPLNTWCHVALVRSGTTLNTYLNGVLGNTQTGMSQTFASTGALNIGRGRDTSTNYLTGYISNVRLVKGVAVYTGAFTVPTSPLTATQSSGTNIAAITGTSTSLLTLQSTTFIDNSTNNFTITAYGNSQPTQQNPFGFTSATTEGYSVSTIGGSGYFDGSGDYLSIPNNTNFGTLSGDFTIECWFYPTAATMGAGTLFTCRNFSVVQYVPYLVWIESTTITVYMSSNGGSWNIISGGNAGTMKPFQWQHFALVRSGSAIKTYLNGVVQSAAGTFSGTLTNTAPFNIGASPNDSNPFFYGYITDTRLVNGTALYTNNFAPPLAPLTAIRNTSLLTNMTSAGIYDAAMMTNMETLGDAKLSTAVTKFGGSSMSFDGTGDYLFAPTSTVNNLSKFLTSNFTVECWIYPTTTSGDRTVICAVNNWGAGANYEIELRSGLLFVQLGNGVTMTSGTTSISANTWTHIALVRSSATSTTFYVNGVSVSTYTTSWTADEDCPLTIGCFNINGGSLANYWQGYIDDLRITKGYARYTTNFTPPTTPFQLY